MSDHLNNLLPEESLLLSLCRLKFNDLNKQEINEYLLQVTDWDYFSRLANEHGIIGLIWNNLTETGNSSTIPARYLERLHSGYFKSLKLHQQLTIPPYLFECQNTKYLRLTTSYTHIFLLIAGCGL